MANGICASKNADTPLYATNGSSLSTSVSFESARGKHIQRCRVSDPAGETARDAGVAWLEIQRLKLLSCERHCLQALGYMPMPVVAILDVLDVVLHIVRHLSLN